MSNRKDTFTAQSPSPSSSSARQLPPGTILGKTTSTTTTPTTTTRRGSKGDNDSAAHAIASSSTATATAALAASSSTTAGCPPDVESLGRATWTFLHTTAAYYPETPTPTQRAHMLQLLHALPQLYPCSHCADDLGARMQRRPPDVRSRTALAAWLCATHNEVNAELGKPAFDCGRVDERWRDGPSDGSCD
ncbi:ERV/ALR sulfhydryl oxidase domain-containing protein [Russula vinacea]|nr:ERV/ALR sulfhydryl oxidase domain-containing protein [Russula vinacea]